jgi:hypothetical protein
MEEGLLLSHLKRKHIRSGIEKCCFIKISSTDNPKDYWLYIDMPLDSRLAELDEFLRQIWLECCGHMSSFYVGNTEVGKKRFISEFNVGESLRYEYDFGLTTELKIDFISQSYRQPYESPVRLLGRNEPKLYSCTCCGADAVYVCSECFWDQENPFYCEDCAKEDALHAEFMLLIANSPRMGICAYGGRLDKWDVSAKRHAI